jgi:hypothetical protein
MGDISRDVYEGAGPNGIDVRLYNYNGNELASVTTVLKTLDDDKGGLYKWQDRNDGSDDNAFHEYLFWYSRNLGTLSHWYALKELDEELAWTEDEASSLAALNNIDVIEDDDEYVFADDRLGDVHVDGSKHEEIHDATPRDVLYSVLKGDSKKYGGTVDSWGEFYDVYPPHRPHQFYTDGLIERVEQDVSFFRHAQLDLWENLGITEDSTIAVEEMLFDTEYGYAGQVDLVYEDPNGHIVVADLKSSSGCYPKHQIQGAAYGKAIEREMDINVDRLEVHRTHPRTGCAVAHTADEANGLREIHETKYWNKTYEELWEQFTELVADFEYDV